MAAKKKSRLPSGVTLRADGRYYVRATATDPITCRRRDRNRLLPVGADLTQAVGVLEELRAALAGEHAPPTQAPTLVDYCAQWLARRSSRVRPKTIETYAMRLGHLLEAIGHLRIDEVERRHLVWYRDLVSKQDVSHATGKSRWRDAKIVLRDAFAEFGLGDLTSRIESPQASGGQSRSLDTLSKEEVDALVDALTGRYASLVRFLARAGCRLGEARGLRWCDLDLDARVASICRSVTELGGPGLGRWQVSAPKNGRARKVGLTADLVKALVDHRASYPGVGEALVWTTSSGDPAHYQTIINAIRSAAKRSGLEAHVSPQVLRRTVNSLALAAGVDRVLLQGMIGHSGDAMSAHYHGLRAETAARIADEVWS